MEVIPHNQTLVLSFGYTTYDKFQTLQNRKRKSQFICAETKDDLEYYLRNLPRHKYILLYFHKVEPNVDERICLTNLRDRYFKYLVVIKVHVEKTSFGYTFLKKFNKNPGFLKRHSCLLFRETQLIFPNPLFHSFDTRYHNDDLLSLSKIIRSTLCVKTNQSKVILNMFGSNVTFVDPRVKTKPPSSPSLTKKLTREPTIGSKMLGKIAKPEGKPIKVKIVHKMSILIGISIATTQKRGIDFTNRVIRLNEIVKDIYGTNFLSIIHVPFDTNDSEEEKEYLTKLPFLRVMSRNKLQQVQGAVAQFFSLRSLPKFLLVNMRRIRDGQVSYRMITSFPKSDDKLLRMFENEKLRLIPVKKYFKLVLSQRVPPNTKRRKMIEKMRADIAKLNSDSGFYESIKVILSCRNLIDRNRTLTNTIYHIRKKSIVGLLFVRNGCSGSELFVNVISEFHNRVTDRDPHLLEIVYISFEKNERRSIQFMNDHDLNAKSIPWDYEQTSKNVKALFGVRSCPRCFFINFAKNSKGGVYLEIRLDELRRMKNFPHHMMSQFLATLS